MWGAFIGKNGFSRFHEPNSSRSGNKASLQWRKPGVQEMQLLSPTTRGQSESGMAAPRGSHDGGRGRWRASRDPQGLALCLLPATSGGGAQPERYLDFCQGCHSCLRLRGTWGNKLYPIVAHVSKNRKVDDKHSGKVVSAWVNLPVCGLLGSQPVQKDSAESWGCLQGLPVSGPLDTALLSKSRPRSSCVAHGSPVWAVCHRPGSGGPWARRKGECLELGHPRPCGEGGNFSSNRSPTADSVMQGLQPGPVLQPLLLSPHLLAFSALSTVHGQEKHLLSRSKCYW